MQAKTITDCMTESFCHALSQLSNFPCWRKNKLNYFPLVPSAGSIERERETRPALSQLWSLKDQEIGEIYLVQKRRFQAPKL